MSEKLPKFLITENLNRMAKWLRILGYDTALYKSISFSNMNRVARKDRRVILTRDRKHLKMAQENKIILIRSIHHLKQLKEIKSILTFEEKYLFSRCIHCNKLLYEISGRNIKELIPEFIYKNHNEFRICRKCGKIYWRGSHYKEMLNKLEIIFKSDRS